MTIALYARRKGWPVSGVTVRLRHSRIHADDCAECETAQGMLDRIESEITIADCLAQVILNDRSAIVTYDRGAGIGFSDRDVENDFKTVLKAYDKLGGTNLAQVQPRDPDRALQLIETYLRYQLSGNPRFSAAVIIDYGETVAP